MKFKNYKSAIHNFTHSFMSIDNMKSGRLSINVLIGLHNLNIYPNATFDFINKTILPIEAETKESQKVLSDYLNWLPEHFANHDCDPDKLEKLEINIWTDFNVAKTPPGMSNSKEITIYSKTIWKADQRMEETIEISLKEIVKESYLRLGLPEFT